MIRKFEKFRYQDFESIEKDIKDILNNIEEIKYNNIIHHNGITINITFKEITEIRDISNDIIRLILLLKNEFLHLVSQKIL